MIQMWAEDRTREVNDNIAGGKGRGALMPAECSWLVFCGGIPLYVYL